MFQQPLIKFLINKFKLNELKKKYTIFIIHFSSQFVYFQKIS